MNPFITTTGLPTGSIGALYDQFLSVIDGTPGYTFAITAGALPPGIALIAGTGEIVGTPTASGSYTFIVTVTDSLANTGSASLTISIPTTPTIANSSLPAGTVGIPYFGSLVGTGGAQPYAFSVTAGGLPPGLVLAGTGGITGTPTTVGNYLVTIKITDSNLPVGSSTSTFTVTIQPADISNPVTTMDEVVLIAGDDGALYAIVPGQRHDQNYAGAPVGFLQKWDGVPGAETPTVGLQQLGGATVAAKGNGNLNVTAKDNVGRLTPLTKDSRQMILSEAETTRDLPAVGVPHSERFGITLDNGGVIDAWFEAHVAQLYIRPFFSGRKA